MSPLIPDPTSAAPPPSSSPPPPTSSPSPPSPSPEAKEPPLVDHLVWSALAGPNARLPAVGSRVYYFAQGHSGHCSSPPDFAALPRRPASIIRYVVAITFHGDPNSGEVYAKITLDARPPPPLPTSLTSPDGLRPVFFLKSLTNTDTTSWGFTVPAGSAERVFPPLDWTLRDASQMIPVREVDGTQWMMLHKYRRKPARNTLTRGWTKFLEKKKPEADDEVVFARDVSGDLVVSLRRQGDLGGWVRPESVLEELRKAEMDAPFNVAYYPRYGPLDFLVGVSDVEEASGVTWLAQMRIKKYAHKPESGELVELKGTVINTAAQDPVLWPGSKWRTLEVSWDEANEMPYTGRVSAWDVILTTLQIQQLPEVSAEGSFGSTRSNASGQIREKVLRLFGTDIKIASGQMTKRVLRLFGTDIKLDK